MMKAKHGGTERLCSCCIVTLWLWVGIWPISSSHAPYLTYMCGPLCLLLASLCPSSPHDIHSPSCLPHTDLLSGQSFCQDSMLTVSQVILPGLHALWHIIRVICPNQEVGTTWGSLARTPHS